MTRDEVKVLFYIIQSIYPNFHQKDSDDKLRTAIDGWWMVLKNYDAKRVTQALNRFASDPDRGRFMPTPADIVSCLPEDRTTDPLQQPYTPLYLRGADGNAIQGADGKLLPNTEENRKMLGGPKLRVAK